MAYTPATDFLALLRNTGGALSMLDMPGLDFVVAALARAGVITLTVSATPPVANQATTAWLQAAVPSYSAEGVLNLWDKVTTAYLPATPALFLQFLEACADRSGVSWWTTAGGPPINTVGNDGDYAIRTDNPGGIYGPKVLGDWPASPLPGTTNAIESVALDNTFGSAEGLMLYRGLAEWLGLPIGTTNQFLTVEGGLPAWTDFIAFLDVILGTVQGSILYRSATQWKALGPGAAGLVLTANGPGADPTYTAKSAEFVSGTRMLFQQSAAPTGWTKDTSLDNYGLRVVAGSVGNTPGTAFSSVFSQSAVGSTTLSAAQMPSHSHTISPNPLTNPSTTGSGIGGGGAFGPPQVAVIGSAGNDQSHTHSILLSLAYTDVIIATKN